MPDAETVLREQVEKLGWTIKSLPPIPGERGYLEIRDTGVALRVWIPGDAPAGFDPWDTLLQALYRLMTWSD